ncbi:HMCN [Mytilus coruscus]|uniref:HMCN n=1 Tax=Mytilus coruscus TaxID=42192 RepID=A0A6J8EDB9_MYTCO|nr:HMCN [Mytilus coruscus]
MSYHLENDTVILPCQQLTYKPIWYGPPNLTTYAIGAKINRELSKSDRLSIMTSDGNSQFNLRIQYFSIDDEGPYKCFSSRSWKSVQETYFNLKKAKAPTNLKIETEETNQTVYGYLNKLFNLTCTVMQGIPKGNLLWLVNNKTLAETETSSLVLSFKPKQKDHLKQFTCVTRSNFIDFELHRTVQLFIYMPPNVWISHDHNAVILDEGDDLTLYCNYSSNNNITDLKWNILLPMKSQLGTSQSSPDLFIRNIQIGNAGQYVCTVSNMAGNGSDNVTIAVNSPLKAPQNIMAVAFSDRIIVKWTSDLDIGLQETFVVEYRKHVESLWSQVFVENRYTAVIDGLVTDTVYLIRVYSRTASGKSYRTNNIIVKTAFKNRQKFCKNNERVAQAQRHDEISVQPARAHYDEIDSMYYNPINETISPQNIRSNTQRTPSTGNANFEINETSNSSSENITTYIDHQVIKSSHENNSPGTSSDESYLVPCRNYIDFDIENIPENQHLEINVDELEIPNDESSVSSDNSETNIKNFRKYESLKGSDVNEHCYKNCNDIDV